MTEDEFLKYLGRQVQRYRGEYSLNEGRAFGLWYAIDSLGLQEDEAYEAVSYDGGNDKDVDFLSIDLIAEHSERIDQSTRIKKATLSISGGHSFEEKGTFGSAFVTTLGGHQLRELYLEHGDRLFDRNIRLFLGARKGGVNAGIRDTIDSDTERSNFWAYNNGVTFVCDSYDFDTQLTLHNFSIVNGCQTTVTIGNSMASAAKKVRALVRFIAAPERAIDSIIRFTNSQNPIRLWDLSAQDKLQKRLKKELAALPQPFLYVLRKGETRQLSATERKKFKRSGTGALCLIPHDLNAQNLAAFRGLPAIAYKDKGRIFSAYYDDVFPDQIRPEEVVLAWQAASIASGTVKAELERAVQEEELDRIAILKRGAKYFVVAAMAIILHERNGKTFLNKLKAEVAVSKTTEVRLKNYATIALEWYVEAMQELIDAGADVSTLVRSQESWTKVRQRVTSKWKVYSLAKKVVQDALPIL